MVPLTHTTKIISNMTLSGRSPWDPKLISTWFFGSIYWKIKIAQNPLTYKRFTYFSTIKGPTCQAIAFMHRSVKEVTNCSAGWTPWGGLIHRTPRSTFKPEMGHKAILIVSHQDSLDGQPWIRTGLEMDKTYNRRFQKPRHSITLKTYQRCSIFFMPWNANPASDKRSQGFIEPGFALMYCRSNLAVRNPPSLNILVASAFPAKNSIHCSLGGSWERTIVIST